MYKKVYADTHFKTFSLHAIGTRKGCLMATTATGTRLQRTLKQQYANDQNTVPPSKHFHQYIPKGNIFFSYATRTTNTVKYIQSQALFFRLFNEHCNIC